jgi:hypothetical protein
MCHTCTLAYLTKIHQLSHKEPDDDNWGSISNDYPSIGCFSAFIRLAENEGLCNGKNPPKETIPPKGINIRALLAFVVWDSVPEDV